MHKIPHSLICQGQVFCDLVVNPSTLEQLHTKIFAAMIYSTVQHVTFCEENRNNRTKTKINWHLTASVTVKPDVLFRAILQTSAATLVFSLTTCPQQFATAASNLLALVANLRCVT